MAIKKKYSQPSRVQRIFRPFGARQETTKEVRFDKTPIGLDRNEIISKPWAFFELG